MGKSWILLCLILFSTRLEARIRSKRFKENIIKVDSPECEVSGVVMSCDYKGQEEPLYVEPLQNTQIQMVYLSNIKDLYLDECVAVNLSVTNIQRLSIKPSENVNCQEFKLSAKYSNLSEIPKAVTRLYLEECNVEMIQPKLSLSEFLVIGSNVQQVDVAVSLVNGTVAIMQSSRIANLRHYTADSGSTLMIKETTIDRVHPNALDLRDGKIVLGNSIFNRAGVSLDGVLLGGVTYHVEGTLTMTPFNKFEVFDTLEQVSYFNLFCVFLVLFLVSSIAFCAYIIRREFTSRNPKKEQSSEVKNYSPVSAEEDKVTGCDDKRNSATEIDLREIIDEIKKELEITELTFKKDKRWHINEIEKYEKEIKNAKENNETRLKPQEDKINEYFSYMNKLEATKNHCVTLLGRIIKTKSHTKEKKESPSAAEKSQWTDLRDAVLNCESQVNQTLSHLEGPKQEKKKQSSIWSFRKRPSPTPVDPTLLKNIPQHLEESYTEFWKTVKPAKSFGDILKYTHDEVNDAIFRCKLSTLETLISIQEISISNVMKCISTE